MHSALETSLYVLEIAEHECQTHAIIFVHTRAHIAYLHEQCSSIAGNYLLVGAGNLLAIALQGRLEVDGTEGAQECHDNPIDLSRTHFGGRDHKILTDSIEVASH